MRSAFVAPGALLVLAKLLDQADQVSLRLRAEGGLLADRPGGISGSSLLAGEEDRGRARGARDGADVRVIVPGAPVPSELEPDLGLAGCSCRGRAEPRQQRRVPREARVFGRSD